MSYPRVNYEMTEDDLSRLMNACKPQPCIKIGSYTPRSQQESANMAWKELGERMGFDYTTVRPIQGKNARFFSAVPNETEYQKVERLKREEAEKKRLRVLELRRKMVELTEELAALEKNMDDIIED